jgi:hypothetical protein
VAVKKSFLIYGRDEFGNLRQSGGEVPSMVAFGKYGIAFRGAVTDYGNSTYLMEYYPTQAGEFHMYVTIGCCTPAPSVGQHAEAAFMRSTDLLITGAPFLLTVDPAAVAPSRSVAVGHGVVGTTVGEKTAFYVLLRDIHNNPTTSEAPGQVSDSMKLEIVFQDSLTLDIVQPASLSIVYHKENVTVEYSHTRAGTYLMSAKLTVVTSIPGRNAFEAPFVSRLEESIIGSPFTILMNPDVADPSRTVCRGLGLRQALVGSTASFEIQLFDRFNNNLVVGGDKFFIRVFGDYVPVGSSREANAAVPVCVDSTAGTYKCQYSLLWPGAHNISVLWLTSSETHPGGSGLWGSYYGALNGAQPYLERLDSGVSITSPNGTIIPLQAENGHLPLGGAGQSIRWVGYIVSPRTDKFNILMRLSNANATIHIDSLLVFDSVSGVANAVSFVQDAAYKIEILLTVDAFSPYTRSVSAALVWSTKTITEYTIPRYFLYSSALPIALTPFPVVVTK